MKLPRRRKRREENWQARLYLKLLVLAAAIAYAAAFVIENHRDTQVHFVFHRTRVSLIWLILLSLAIGVLGGVLMSQLYRRRRRQELRRSRLFGRRQNETGACRLAFPRELEKPVQ